MRKTMTVVFSTLIALSLVGGIGASVASAQSKSKVIEQRRAAMKQLGGHMKAIGIFMKKGQGTAADVAARAEKVAAIAAAIPTLFPRGTSLNDGAGETGAKPEIWQQATLFRVRSGALHGAARAFAAVAKTGNKQGMGAVMGVLGKEGCGGCHRVFRKKLK